MKNMIACLLVVTFISCQMWADPGSDQTHSDAVKKKVAHGLDHQRRVFETYDNRRSQGVITEAGANDFVVSYAGQKTTLLYWDARKMKWQSAARAQVRVVVEDMVEAVAVMGAVRPSCVAGRNARLRGGQR